MAIDIQLNLIVGPKQYSHAIAENFIHSHKQLNFDDLQKFNACLAFYNPSCLLTCYIFCCVFLLLSIGFYFSAPCEGLLCNVLRSHFALVLFYLLYIDFRIMTIIKYRQHFIFHFVNTAISNEKKNSLARPTLLLVYYFPGVVFNILS